MSNFTKGEWYERHGDIWTDNDRIASTCSLLPRVEEAKANAYLIAASPDMYEACKEWLDIWMFIRDKYPDIELPFAVKSGSDACGRLREALAKADGNQ